MAGVAAFPARLLRLLSLLAVAALVVADGGSGKRGVGRSAAVISLAELDARGAGRKNPSSYEADSKRADMLGNCCAALVRVCS